MSLSRVESPEFIDVGFYRPGDEYLLSWNKSGSQHVDFCWWPDVRPEKIKTVPLALALLMDRAVHKTGPDLVLKSKWASTPSDYDLVWELYLALERIVWDDNRPDIWIIESTYNHDIGGRELNFLSNWNMPIGVDGNV